MTALGEVLVHMRALQILAGVDETATDFQRGHLAGTLDTLALLADHGLELSQPDTDGAWRVTTGG